MFNKEIMLFKSLRKIVLRNKAMLEEKICNTIFLNVYTCAFFQTFYKCYQILNIYSIYEITNNTLILQ